MAKAEEVKNQSLAVIKRAGVLIKSLLIKITNQKDYDVAGAFLLEIKERKAKETLRFKPIVDKAYQTHKEAKKQLNDALEPLLKVESKLRDMRIEYHAEQEKKQIAEQARLDAIQEKEKAKLEKRAQTAIDKGQEEKAEVLKEEAQEIETITPYVPIKINKTEGIQMKKILKFRVKNPLLVPRYLLILDTVKIGQEVRVSKGTVEIPGIEIYWKTIEAV